jgi:hypothetical protein
MPTIGDGSSGSPYEIASLENLYWLTQNSSYWTNSSYFIQTTNIDASGSSSWTNSSGTGYMPIGDKTNKFNGNYNGQGYSITGIYIETEGSNDNNYMYKGMFGYTDAATITNVEIVDCNISCYGYAGGLAGYLDGGTVISHCFAFNVNIESKGLGYVGGLVGQNKKSYIDSCYASGSVWDKNTGSQRFGGLVGHNKDAYISNCYAATNVSGYNYVGGFSGYSNGGTISYCYSVGKVIGTGSPVGGFTASNAGTISYCFYNSETAGMSDAIGGDPKTSTELKTKTTFTDVGWDFTNLWEILEGVTYPGLQNIQDAIVISEVTSDVVSLGDSYSKTVEVSYDVNESITFELLQNPVGLSLSGKTISGSVSTAGAHTIEFKASYTDGKSSSMSYSLMVTSMSGSGTSTDPYTINSLADLQALSVNSDLWNAYFKQTTDINASESSTWNAEAGFSPIGDETTEFAGVYDGQGFSIDSLYINRTSTDYVGLFGKTKYASIKKLALTNCIIKGNENVGVLIGRSDYDTITNCYTTGSVSGSSKVGGFIGKTFNDTIANCYATSSVAASNVCGGFVGENKGNLTHCFATGSVLGNSDTGGLVGTHSSTYFITNCYYNTESSSQNDTDKGDGKSIIEMQNQTIFSSWDFTNTWSMENSSFPCLQCLNNAPIILQNTSKYQCSNTLLIDTIHVIGMDNQSISIELIKKPYGMTLNDSILNWTPTTLNTDTVVIKATDGNGLVNVYCYTIEIVSFNGDGIEESPYEISTVDQLLTLIENNSYWDAYFIQTTDIDASSLTGASSIGNFSTVFKGNYNGKGHHISNLNISSDDNYVGVFGYIDGAVIDSLALISCSVTGVNNTGGLVGLCFSSSVTACSYNGTVSGGYNTGGLVGYGYSSDIVACSASNSVLGTFKVGGLIGYSKSTNVSYSYATANVAAKINEASDVEYKRIGGLIGCHEGSSSIDNCYATGQVTGELYVGGFIGSDENSGNISNSYATGNIIVSGDANAYSGTFMGIALNTTKDSVKNCYALGKVMFLDNSDNYYGMFGYLYSASLNQIVSSYYNSDILVNTKPGSSDGTPKTTSEMQTESTYAEWDFVSTWGLITDSTYPALIALNNAPFARIDSVNILNNYAILDNDYDYETGREKLAYSITMEPIAGSIINGVYTFNSDAASFTQDSLSYRIGELVSIGDTLWGNTVTSYFTKKENTAPVITSVEEKSMYENTELTLSIANVIASDAEGDELNLVIFEGDNYSVNGTTLIPNTDYYGKLNVFIAVSDGELNSDTVIMNVTVIAVPDTPVITWVLPDSAVYGELASEDIMNAYANISGAFEYSFTEDSIFNVGIYELYTEFTPSNTLDYSMISSTVQYTIYKAMLTATAKNYTIIAGTEIPELSFTYSEFANNEDESVLETKPTASTTADASSAAGIYDINVAGGYDNNYAFEYENGTLTILARELSLSATELLIDSTENSTVSFNIESNISWTISSTESWLTLSADAGIDSATITLTAEANNTEAYRSAIITVSGDGVDDKTITVTQSSLVGISSSTLAEAYSLYPNPTQTIVRIANVANAYIEIYDACGKIILSLKSDTDIEQINVSDFNLGIYVVRITKNNYTVMKKLIVD